MPINLLDEKTINKIAAGEVIERPSSIVKELIENSIDANSSSIEITIKEGGKDLIVIEDNGIGMNEEDLLKSILRHATSKIIDFNDLFNINTMGFRGEALSSISAVSKLEIISRQKKDDFAIKINVENGKIITKEKVSSNVGTKIIVKDLFYNVPARKKFLKNTNTEKKLIVDIVMRYALINNNIRFVLKDESLIIIQKPVTNSIKENIAYVYGHEIAKESFNFENVFCVGVFVKPTINRATKEYISVYVNNRFVKSSIVENAIIDCLRTFLFHDKYPIAVINLKIDASKIDVNVHPSKKIIKFDDEVFVYQEVFDIIKKTVEKNDLFSSYVKKQKNYSQDVLVKENEDFELKAKGKFNINDFKKNYFVSNNEKQKVFDSCVSYEEKDDLVDLKNKELFNEENVIDKSIIVNNQTKKYNVLGQIHKTYILIETNEGYEIIDQHAAHERIMFEKFKLQLQNNKISKQILLNPINIDFDLKEFLLIKNNVENLIDFGFKLEEFGKNNFILRSIPHDFKIENDDYKNLLIDLANKLSQKRNININQKKEEAIEYMACRSAIKAGKELSDIEMKKLIDELFNTKNKYTCPHGRPCIIKFPLSKIESLFKRK
jgi:DNA mismatch repair protein MutL